MDEMKRTIDPQTGKLIVEGVIRREFDVAPILDDIDAMKVDIKGLEKELKGMESKLETIPEKADEEVLKFIETSKKAAEVIGRQQLVDKIAEKKKIVEDKNKELQSALEIAGKFKNWQEGQRK